MRSRWAAIGAAVAVSLGAGGIVAVNAASSVPSSVVTIDPVRILDTRDPLNIGLPGPFVSATSQKLQVAGGPGVPVGATGVLLNVTAVTPTAAGFVAIRPGDATGAPATSSLNVQAGDVIPNAVQVGLPTVGANAGQIDITYDASGRTGPTTELLIDVVGYLVAGAAGPAGPPGPAGPAGGTSAQDKWISIDPLAVDVGGGATIEIGYNSAAGISLPEPSPEPLFQFGFSVPPDHTPNTPITVELLWHINQTSCTISLVENFLSVSRRGSVPRGDTAVGGALTLASDPVSATANRTGRTTATLPSAGFGLAPGDAVNIGFYRTSALDTCTQAVRVTGIRVLYS
jgi:hypothetical protein